jgi:hypothetical protein
VNVLGWDIGGANTKAALIKTRKGAVRELKTAIKYFPIWKKDKEKLPVVLDKLKKQLTGSAKLDGVGVAMTAELSDAYRTKRKGVNHILDSVVQVFPNTSVFVLDAESNLKSIEEARQEPLEIAAANWPATGWMVSQSIKDCFIIDVGSTTTSIIPVINGKVVAAGKTDLEKLLNGELVYTGALRTNVAATVNSIPVKGGIARVSSELFALSGDVHLVLDNINEEDYSIETADGRGTTRIEAMARLARVVCADIEMLNEKEIVEMAKYVYETQIKQIADGLSQVHNRMKPRIKVNVPVVVTGVGRNFLAGKAAQKAGFKEVIDLGELLGVDAAVVSTSVGVALMVASKLEGKVIRW